MVTQNPDGTATILTSVPCDAGLSSEICLVKVRLFYFERGSGLKVLTCHVRPCGKRDTETIDRLGVNLMVVLHESWRS